MDLILQTILLGTATAMLLNLKPYQSVLALVNLNRKPFNCALCLPVWVTLAFHLFYFIHPIPESIIAALCAGFIGDLVDKTLSQF